MPPHPNPSIAALLDGFGGVALPGIDLSLGRMEALLQQLGNPEQNLPPLIHIAGTNGKGSTVAFLSAMGEAAGLRVHRYISPELVLFNERICLAGRNISDATLLPLLERVANALEHTPATAFEATTAAAFLAFAETPADLLVLETGMGGRLDATNRVASPLATVITPVDWDHMEFLGNSLSAIAFEKAGIMKPHTPAILGRQQPEALEMLLKQAALQASPTYSYGRDWRVEDGYYHSRKNHIPLDDVSLYGDHQHTNAATAVAVAECLNMQEDERFHWDKATIRRGLASAKHPGRMQQITLPNGVELWVDGGHNPAAARIIAQVMSKWQKLDGKPVILLMAMMKDKDIAAFMEPLLAGVEQLMVTSLPDNPRAATADFLAATAQSLGKKAIPLNHWQDVIPLLPKKPHRWLVCGSLALAGEVLATYSD